MAQHDMIINDGPGAAVRDDMNQAIAALVSNSSGSIEPAVTYAFQLWLDTGVTPNVLRMRNAANTGWITPPGMVSGGDAVSDGKPYSRKDAGWVEAATKAAVDARPLPPASDGFAYVMRNGAWEKTGRRLLGRINPAVNTVTFADFAIPTGTKALFISGSFRPTAASTYLYMRLSSDGGVTYKSGAGDYGEALFRQQNTALSGVGSAASSALIMIPNSDAVNYNNIPLNTVFSPGDATRINRVMSMGIGYWSGGAVGPTLDIRTQHSATAYVPTHIRILVLANAFDIGTDIILETP